MKYQPANRTIKLYSNPSNPPPKVAEKMRKLETSNEKVAQRKAFMSEKNQILFITAASASLLFIYDGLQVRSCV